MQPGLGDPHASGHLRDQMIALASDSGHVPAAFVLPLEVDGDVADRHPVRGKADEVLLTGLPLAAAQAVVGGVAVRGGRRERQ